jgi:hypothetical protein
MSKNSASSNTPKRSTKRSSVAALLYIEAAVVLALGLWLTVLGFTHEEKEMTPLLAEIGFAAIGSIGLFACARGYVNGKVYGRSPTILANLIAVGVAYYQIQGAFYRCCNYFGTCTTDSVLCLSHCKRRGLVASLYQYSQQRTFLITKGQSVGPPRERR